MFLTGGADTLMPAINLARGGLFGGLSTRNDDPEGACRPFDRQRDGVVVGEGSGVFVLEELEHARRRGAHIHAEVVGFGAAFDRDRSGKGLARAMRAALEEAGIGPDDVDHISAHGLSTVSTDAWEARGITQVFGGATRPVPVFAAKSYFGHLGAGSGAVELATSLLALEAGQVPATLNFQEADADCPLPVTREPIRSNRDHVLKLSFTESGQCAALVCQRWDSRFQDEP
jgi:3-oxoacyl-[acyl-carrier-protein] synthase II